MNRIIMMNDIRCHSFFKPMTIRKRKVAIAAPPYISIDLLPLKTMRKTARKAEATLAIIIIRFPRSGFKRNSPPVSICIFSKNFIA